MRRNFQATCLALGLAFFGSAAQSQSNWGKVAVPVYTPVQLMQGLHQHWTSPQSESLANEARSLTQAIDAYCKAAGSATDARLEPVRRQWRTTATAWERLSGVAVGPLLERRSVRQIDFMPARPALIERAIKTAPRSADAMERIGAPAKGFPALEWLLWTSPVVPDSPACAYAVAVARDLERETDALRIAFKALAERPVAEWDDETAVAGMEEFVNQWVGGLERLRWAGMEKPVRASAPHDLPRAASGTTAVSWAAHWHALRVLTQFSGETAPVPGNGLVPIETYLRGRAANPLADRLVSAVEAANASVKAAEPASTLQVLAAAAALGELKRLAEAEIAPAMEVSIGFSNADGD